MVMERNTSYVFYVLYSTVPSNIQNTSTAIRLDDDLGYIFLVMFAACMVNLKHRVETVIFVFWL